MPELKLKPPIVKESVLGYFEQSSIFIAINRESPYLCWGVIKQMTMESRDKYTAPETEVLELHLESVIADSENSNDGDPD